MISDEVSAGDALNALDELANHQLRDRLPGLGAVLQVLREQIAQAFLDEAAEEIHQGGQAMGRAVDFANIFGAGPGPQGAIGPQGAPGVAAPRTTVNEIVIAMDAAKARDLDEAYMAAKRSAIKARRGF